MRTVDLSPLYRSFIGFDHLASLMDAAARTDKQPSFPPYNIEALDKDKYRITMAVAGFSDSELTIESENNTLKVLDLNANEISFRGCEAIAKYLKSDNCSLESLQQLRH